MTTADEFEIKILDVIYKMNYFGLADEGEAVKELLTRYKTVKIMANNYKKALEALDHATKQ